MMKQRIIYYRFVAAGFCALLALFTAVPAHGDATSTASETFLASSTVSSSTSARAELEQQIQDRSKALETIGAQLDATRTELYSTRRTRSTLQQELFDIQGNISTLNLSIKADEISIQKLDLESQSLQYDLGDIKSSIADKETAMANILNEVQRLDRSNGSLLAVFLRNASLADGVLEAQALTDLQSQLTLDVNNLKQLHDDYSEKIAESGQKKQNMLLHQVNLKNKELIVQDQKAEREALLAATRDKESVYAKQLSALEKQQEQIANEIETLDAVLRTKIDPSMLPTPAPGVLAWPLENGRAAVTQGYGRTGFAIKTYHGQWHNGIDIGEPIGTPVMVPADGTVVAVGNQDNYCPRAAYGKFIVIQHPNNLVTLYGHLSRQIVAKGDAVAKGQVIGYVGRTGWATGPHLHFTVFAGPTYYLGLTRSCGPMPYGGDLNPLSYLP